MLHFTNAVILIGPNRTIPNCDCPLDISVAEESPVCPETVPNCDDKGGVSCRGQALQGGTQESGLTS